MVFRLKCSSRTSQKAGTRTPVGMSDLQSAQSGDGFGVPILLDQFLSPVLTNVIEELNYSRTSYDTLYTP